MSGQSSKIPLRVLKELRKPSIDAGYNNISLIAGRYEWNDEGICQLISELAKEVLTLRKDIPNAPGGSPVHCTGRAR